ncbi:sulfurtransferase [Aestuariivivens sediminis]|uniref:sulfurtransferase n=1 Tax=Aestuariivivens sediminis TaxID=2913557 RepID=UPI001F59AAD2|nr:sulfurtransferase [Aestuariivivens sediminis]
MSNVVIEQPVVPVDWLHDHLNVDNLVILDGTMSKVFDRFQSQIPKARYFDIKNKFSNVLDPFPNAFPSTEQFEKEARALGINKNSAIVVYDDKGIYSSARVWWMFKAFGHLNVAVLDGGFPAWTNAKYPVEPMTPFSGPLGDFTAQLQPGKMVYFKEMKTISTNQTHKILDARSAARFNSQEPEPRAGLRMGTIPNSANLPYEDLLEEGVLKPNEQLHKAFEALVNKDDEIVFSCGSGITACVLALGAELSGYKNIKVYDGSWTEWGTLVKA